MKKVIRLTSEGFYMDGALTPCRAEQLLETLRGAVDGVVFGRATDIAVERPAGRTADPVFDRLEVEIDSLAMVVVPVSCYDNALADSYLAAANMAVAGHRAVWVVCGEVVIVTSCRDDVAAWLAERYGDAVAFTSPLGEALALPERLASPGRSALPSRAEVFSVHLTEANAYIALWHNGLKFAEALPYSSPADIVYYVSRLAAAYGLRREKVYLSGAVAEKFHRELARSITRLHYADNKRRP